MSSRFFDLSNSMIYDLKRSVHLRWLLDWLLHSSLDDLVLGIWGFMFSLLLLSHLFWQKNSAVPCIFCNLSLKFTAMHHWGSLKLIELNCFLYVFDVIFVFHINIDAVRPLCHCQFQDILFFHKAIFLLYSYMFQTKTRPRSPWHVGPLSDLIIDP